jgi:thiamine-phosphate pyrophosphorylase
MCLDFFIKKIFRKKLVMTQNINRILDANLNRAREGLRVIEEYYRFLQEDKSQSQAYKDLRHVITSIIKTYLNQEDLIQARNVSRDVLATEYQDSEGRRDRAEDVLKANVQRVKESLRVLEEYGKMINSDLGKAFQTLRFRIYELEKS